MSDTSTNPGDRSVTELEREVDQERARVSATVDELQTRASAANILDQVVKAVTENGGDVSRNLGRSLRDNPMAALLTGVGVAWLMAGGGSSRQTVADGGRDSFRRYPDTDRYPETGRYSETEFGTDTDFVAGETYVRPSFAEGGTDEEGSDEGSGIGGRLSDAAHRVGDAVSGAVGGLQDRASGLSSGMSHSARSAYDSTRGAVGSAGRGARHQMGGLRNGAAGAGESIQNGFDTLVEEQPLVLGALAMALGAAVGGVLPRSNAEDRMFGARADEAKQKVQNMVQEQGSKLQDVASAVVDEAVEIAHEATDEAGRNLPSGREMADAADRKVHETADRLKQAASETGRDPNRV